MTNQMNGRLHHGRHLRPGPTAGDSRDRSKLRPHWRWSQLRIGQTARDAFGFLRPVPANADKPIALALQGGGSHGAFTWGVLDRLLEEDALAFTAVSGASACTWWLASEHALLTAGHCTGSLSTTWIVAPASRSEDLRPVRRRFTSFVEAKITGVKIVGPGRTLLRKRLRHGRLLNTPWPTRRSA